MADTQLIARQLLSDLKRDFGLTDEQAAGVVGNLMHESGGFNSLQEVNPTVPGSAGGFGFAQWTGPRRKSFDSYVEKQGLDRNSYAANYGFLKHELETNRYERNQFNKVKKAGTAAEAARIVSENYLRPGIPHNASRVRYAEQVLPFAKMPVPPGEMPTVGTLQDTRQPVVPPLPTTSAPNLATLRANTSPTGGNSDLQTALDRVATRERNRVTPASADERITARNRAWVEASPAQVTTVATIPSVQPPRPSLTAPGGVDAVVGGLQQDSGLAAALAARTAPQARPALPMSYAGQERAPRPASRPVTPMSINVAQSYAGQERGPRPSVFNGDPGTRANGPVVAQIPTVAPRQAPVPASPFDRVSARLNALPSIERLPEIAPPAVGGPPTTRVVQSVPVRPSQSSGQGINAQRSEQAMTRQATPMPVPVQRAAQAPSDIGRMPSMAEMQATLGRPLSPSAVGGLYENVFPNPLAPAGVPANPNADIGVATLLDTIDPRTGLRTAAPTGPLAYAMPPMPRSRPYAAMPSLPIPRPGIGGPYRAAPIPATMSPFTALRRSLPALPTPRPPTSPAAQRVWMTGFSDSGSSGGAHGGSDNDKHRGETVTYNGWNMR